MFNWPTKSSTVVEKKDYRVYPANVYSPVGPHTAGWAVEEYDGKWWRRVCTYDTIELAQQAIDFIIKQGK